MNDNYAFKIGNKLYDLSSRTFVMGVLNVTPDSFSDGGKYFKLEDAVARAKQIESEGADFIDVGGQSTRPGSEEISLDEEMNRVIPVIEAISKAINIPISVDTYRSSVADEACKKGATIVNDISGFNMDENMTKIIAFHKATAIAMHMKGSPKTMQENPSYENVVDEVKSFFENAAWKSQVQGIEQLILDPGIGFGKTFEHNLALIKNLQSLKKLDCPVMIGVSRKSLINKIYEADVNDRLEGTIALNSISIMNGANIIRVHDVKAGVRTAKILDAYKKV